MDPAPHCAGISQQRLGFTLAIDQLQHTEDFALPIFHGESDQRTRPVADLLIKCGIEVKRPCLWHAIGISQLDHFAVERAIPRHRILGQRKRVFAEGKLYAVVLRQLEPQLRTS